MIFEQGCPVFVIAKALGTSEAQIYRYLGDEKIAPEKKVKLKKFMVDLVEMNNVNITFCRFRGHWTL
jgi:hypothetical protein